MVFSSMRLQFKLVIVVALHEDMSYVQSQNMRLNPASRHFRLKVAKRVVDGSWCGGVEPEVTATFQTHGEREEG